MSPNHHELEEAIRELREERPSADRRERVLRAIQEPTKRNFKLPSLIAATTVAIAGVILMLPTRKSGLAWAEVLRRSQAATNMHCTYLNASGAVIGESWRSATNWALWLKDSSGRISCENRSDQSHFYLYLYRPQLSAPNAVQYGTLWNKTPAMLANEKLYGGPVQTIDALMNRKFVKLVRQEASEFDGRPVQRYELQMYGKEFETVDADPKSGRIVAIHTKDGEVDRFDYPASLDSSIFSYKARLTKDVAVLDLRGKEEPKKLPPYMPPVIASKGGIQLRSVSIGEEGDLFVAWTGTLLPSKARKRVKVVGVKTAPTGWPNAYPSYFKGGLEHKLGPLSKRLICGRLKLLEKVGSRLTIMVPTIEGYAEFRDVRVAKLKPLKE